ncbi:MAG: carbon-phosphorus lyase complex subunit PhnI [Acidithiobacillus sp.]
MSYVAVKGGAAAIHAAHSLVAEQLRCGSDAAPRAEMPDAATLRAHLRLGVDRVMAEASLYAPELAAQMLLQAQGDTVEAVFLLRAYRATLSRYLDAEPFDTQKLRFQRRISAAFKDMPGGQQLGITYDYSHRLLGYFDKLPEENLKDTADEAGEARDHPVFRRGPGIMDHLVQEGLMEGHHTDPAPDAAMNADITRRPPEFPAGRCQRLQTLARADEGFLLGLAYSTQRGYGQNHPFIAELCVGSAAVELCPPELDFSICIGYVEMTECQMINQFHGNSPEEATLTRGYGLVMGQAERKAIAMALVDRALRARELGEKVTAPAQDEEFVLSHCDNVEATGFVEHLKLPHHVDFQSEIALLRAMHGVGATPSEQADDAL